MQNMVFDKGFLNETIRSLQICLNVEERFFIDAYEKLYEESRGAKPEPVVWKRDVFSLHANETSYPQAFHIGVDLPLYFKKEGNTKSVVFLGEDPLRPDRAKSDSELVISTPFALHRVTPKGRSHRLIHRMVQELLVNGYNVYVTDVFKVWLKRGRTKVDLFRDSNFLENSFTLLEREFDQVSGSASALLPVVALGNKAALAFTRMGISGNHAFEHWLHPAAYEKEFKQSKERYYSDKVENLKHRPA